MIGFTDYASLEQFFFCIDEIKTFGEGTKHRRHEKHGVGKLRRSLKSLFLHFCSMFVL